MKFLLSRSILLVIFAMILLLLAGYARGYRVNVWQKKVVSTGILVASSSPDGAKIYINGKLEGATNSNISLSPGAYDVQIKKDGYSTWKKTITIKGELVLKADALLFPQNPSLSPITSLGVITAQFFPNSSRAVIVSKKDPENTSELIKDGLYLLENAKKPLNIFNPLKLIAPEETFPIGTDFKESAFSMSPDSKQILMTIKNKTLPEKNFLLSTEETTPSLFDVTNSINTIKSAWEREENRNSQKILETFKEPLAKVASDSFKIISFSPDESKILYSATRNTNLAPVITPPLIATNQTEETRNIELGSLYVYDKKEDKNYLIKPGGKKIAIETESFFWYPDSSHLVIKEENRIDVIDYDGTNRQAVYSGPFEKNFLGVTAEGKLLILANLNPQKNKLPDIYAVGIR